MVLIVDYGLGNLYSVSKAFEMLGAEVLVSGEQRDIERAERIVLPGVGAFGDGMENLSKKGITNALKRAVLEDRKPFLGICLGMQLLADIGTESGNTKGLGWIHGETLKLDVAGKGLKVPHIGWNDVSISEPHPLWNGIKDGSDFYFLHSYTLVCDEKKDVAATSVYGMPFTSAVQKDSIFAVQFHPEKSQDNGLKFLENFMSWEPSH